MNHLNVKLFYERIQLPGVNSFVIKITVPILLALSFLIPHGLAVGTLFFEDWSLLLSSIVLFGMLCVFFGTHALRNLLFDMAFRISDQDSEFFNFRFDQILSDKNLILSGTFFGAANVAMGYLFGVPYESLFANCTIFYGFFLAGFVCGMAVAGIYSATRVVGVYAKYARKTIDYAAPDGTGGTLFVGEAILLFSFITLFCSFLISIYILKMHWVNNHSVWINCLKAFWLLLPYIVSLCCFIAPAIPINTELRRYKRQQDKQLTLNIARIRAQLIAEDKSEAQLEQLREDYEYQLKLREQLHKMRTWPYGAGNNFSYMAAMVSGACSSGAAAWDWLAKLLPSGH